jgi:hypothetical protein
MDFAKKFVPGNRQTDPSIAPLFFAFHILLMFLDRGVFCHVGLNGLLPQ